MQRLVSGGCWLMAMWLTAGTSQAEPQRYALVVGVREYPVSRSLTPLEFTEPDASEIAATLRDGGFEVTLMIQAAAAGTNNQRFSPSAALIRKQFADLVATPFLNKTDCVMVVLGGHGIQLPSRDDESEFIYYFCPSDAAIEGLKYSEDVRPQHNLIPIQELYDTLKKSPAGVRLLVVDACRNDPNKPSAFRSSNSVTRPPLPTVPGGLAALFSCSASQQAAEDSELRHGVFSYFLIEGLKGKADLDGDREIGLLELHQYVGNRTFTHVRQKYSTQQIPEFQGDIKGWAPLLSVPRDRFAGTKAGDLWDGNGLRMKFRWCPPGRFKMGSPQSEPGRHDNENQVDVTISDGFWMGQLEVTQAEWQAVMGTTPWKFKKSVQEGDDYPATHVNWEEASQFCARLTAKGRREKWLPEGWKIDLPTEARWEYACRAGTVTRFSFGDDEAKLSEYAWWGGIAGDGNAKGEQYALQVGQKKPNPWGLHDMHGNVWEWCRDWYVEEPPGGTDPEAVGTRFRVDRGGGWIGEARTCRSANRYWLAPEVRYNHVGFRVACSPVH